LEKWQKNELDTRMYSFRDGLLLYKHKILLGQSPQIKIRCYSMSTMTLL